MGWKDEMEGKREVQNVKGIWPTLLVLKMESEAMSQREQAASRG